MTDGLDRINQIIYEVGKVKDLGPDQDFYDAGVSSIAALSLLMELESSFDVSIPDDKFIAARTPRALLNVVTDLKKE